MESTEVDRAVRRMSTAYRNRHRWRAALLALALCTHATWAAEVAAPGPAQDSAALLKQQAEERQSRLKQMHTLLGIRPDQAALWQQVERRISSQDGRIVDLSLEAQRHRSGRLLDDLALLSRWQSAQAAEQRAMLDALRWLAPQLDAKQRKVLAGMDGKDEPLAPGATVSEQRLEAERTPWLARRAELKTALALRPGQAAAWERFEAETADPMARSRAVLTASRAAKPPFGVVELMGRMQEAIPTDTADWLGALQRLDRSLDGTQRTRLDAFVERHPSPLY